MVMAMVFMVMEMVMVMVMMMMVMVTRFDDEVLVMMEHTTSNPFASVSDLMGLHMVSLATLMKPNATFVEMYKLELVWFVGWYLWL